MFLGSLVDKKRCKYHLWGGSVDAVVFLFVSKEGQR